MNHTIRSSLVLLVVIGFLHSIEAYNVVQRSFPGEGTESEKCDSSTTGYVLMDSCGSYCKCKDGILMYCQEKTCENEVAPYSPVDDYEVEVVPYGGDHVESCEPGKGFYNGCNRCSCRPNGKPGACTRMMCHRPVYRLKE